MPKANSAFLDFIRHVVNGDIDDVARHLAANPAFSRAPSEFGATRQDVRGAVQYLKAGGSPYYTSAVWPEGPFSGIGAGIEWYVGLYVAFDADVYYGRDAQAAITARDPAANLDPSVRDRITVRVTSDADPTGILVSMIEEAAAFPLFHADVIEALRQPLESGEVTIARGRESATFPARGMMLLAANPCPCGNYHPSARDNRCTCTEVKRRDYRSRLSGPIVDRIDIVRHLRPIGGHERRDRFATPEPSAPVRARVAEARQRQERRFEGRAWRLNGQAPGPVLYEEFPLTDRGQTLVDDLVYTAKLSRRGATRVHRLAWTVADLRGLDRPDGDEVDVALRLRQGEALTLTTLRRVG